MPLFYVTFGVRYATEEHPLFPEAHPDGYVVIEAADAHKAREIVTTRLDDRYAFLYPADDWDPSYYPRGAIAKFDQED